MTNEHILKLRQLPTMTEEQVVAAFGMSPSKAMLGCWPVLIDEVCRLEAQLHSEEHLKLDAVMEQNEELREQVQELTDQLGQLTMPDPNARR